MRFTKIYGTTQGNTFQQLRAQFDGLSGHLTTERVYVDNSALFLDVKNFAERSGLAVRAIEKFISEGKLRAVKVGNRKMLSSAQLKNLDEILLKVPVVNKGVDEDDGC